MVQIYVSYMAQQEFLSKIAKNQCIGQFNLEKRARKGTQFFMKHISVPVPHNFFSLILLYSTQIVYEDGY